MRIAMLPPLPREAYTVTTVLQTHTHGVCGYPVQSITGNCQVVSVRTVRGGMHADTAAQPMGTTRPRTQLCAETRMTGDPLTWVAGHRHNGGSRNAIRRGAG